MKKLISLILIATLLNGSIVPWLAVKPVLAVEQQSAPSSQLYFLHQDHLGSTRIVTDRSGMVVEEEEYYPYGEQIPNPKHPFGLSSWPKANSKQIPNSKFQTRLYTGQVFDEETGLYYYNARYYDSRMAHFMSADVVEGPNRYAYVAGNPVNRVDPGGNMYLIEPGKGSLRKKYSEYGFSVWPSFKMAETERGRRVWLGGVTFFSEIEKGKTNVEKEMLQARRLGEMQNNDLDALTLKTELISQEINRRFPYTERNLDADFRLEYRRTGTIEGRMTKDLLICFDIAAAASFLLREFGMESNLAGFSYETGDSSNPIAGHTVVQIPYKGGALITDPTWGGWTLSETEHQKRLSYGPVGMKYYQREKARYGDIGDLYSDWGSVFIYIAPQWR